MNFRRFISPVQDILRVPFGPVFQKEVYLSGRRTATYTVRAAVALLLLMVIGVACIPLAMENSSNSGVSAVQGGQSLAAILTIVIAWFDFGVLLLVTPLILVPSVMEEVRMRTLDSLLTTPISAADIIFGKLAGRGVSLCVLALIPLPLLLVLRTLGGVPGDAVLLVAAQIFCSLLLMGALSMFVSTWMRKPASGIVVAIVCFLLLQSVPVLVVTVMVHDWKLFHLSDPVLVSLSVFPTLYLTLLERIGAVLPLGRAVGEFWYLNPAISLAAAALILAGTTSMLRRSMRRHGEGAPMASESPHADAQPGSPESATTSRRRRRGGGLLQSAMGEVSNHPVFWREMRQPLFPTRLQWIVAGGSMCLLTGLILYLGRLDPQASLVIVLCIALSLALIIASVMTTASIGSEREARTWESLLTTALSAREIILSKFSGSAKRQLLLPLLGAAFIFVYGFLAERIAHPLTVVVWLAYSLGPVLLLAASGTFLSLVSRRSTTAAVWNLVLALSLWGALPALIAAVGYPVEREIFGGTSDYTDRVLSWALIINPVYNIGITTEHLVRLHAIDWDLATEMQYLGTYRISTYTFVIQSVAVFLCYAAASALILGCAQLLFPYYSGRSPSRSTPSVANVPAPNSR